MISSTTRLSRLNHLGAMLTYNLENLHIGVLFPVRSQLRLQTLCLKFQKLNHLSTLLLQKPTLLDSDPDLPKSSLRHILKTLRKQ